MATSWPPMARRGHEVTVDAVRRLERQLGHELPEDYRCFLLEVNGGRPARTHRTFVMQRAGRHRDETTLDTLHSLDDPDEDHDLAAHQLFRHEDYPENGLRIGYDAFGSALVLILSGPHRGEVWYFDIEDDSEDRPTDRVEWFDRRDVWKLADSFAEFMAGLRPLEDGAST
jgi:SMI1/KNR4 family protein SUKH-1